MKHAQLIVGGTLVMFGGALALLMLTQATQGPEGKTHQAHNHVRAPHGYCCGGIHVRSKNDIQKRQQPSPVPDRALVGITMGGRSPDVPWFTLPASAYAPLTTGTPNEPYLTPPGTPTPTLFPADNPANSGFATHTNITRHWTSNPTYTIVLPNASVSPSTVVASTTSFPGTTWGGAGIPVGSSYTWGQWISAVQNAFFAYDSCPTANICTFAGTGIQDYSVSGWGPMVTGTFVWQASTGQGPTGNGLNEIILTDQQIAGIGLASMIVDPATGQIQECDLIFDVTKLIVQLGGVGGPITTPNEWTALRHEIGHFYGLDHTNLHPGIAGANTVPPSFAVGAGPRSTTLAVFPTGLLGGVAPVPGMVGTITHLGLGFDHTTMPLHRDDATCLSKIYPVCTPGPVGCFGGARQPLINTSARIIGRLRATDLVTLPSTFFGVFGRNVWAAPELNPATGFPFAAYPESGTISGTARLTTSVSTGSQPGTDWPLLTDPFIYVRHPLHPLIGGNPWGNEAYFVRSPSVVGASFPGGAASTGDFSIDGLPAGTFDDSNPVAYEVVFEDSAALGVAGTPSPAPLPAPNQAEWFGAAGFYTGNPLAGAPAWVAPPTSPWVATVLRNVFGTIFQSPVRSGIRVVPGTVIALDPREHDDNVAPFLPGSTNTGGVAYAIAPENYSRPLVDIQPRTGFVPGGTLVIKARSTQAALGIFVNPATARLFINGVDVTTAVFGPPGVTPPPWTPVAGISGNPVAQWSIPMATILANALGPNPYCLGGIHVSFVAQEFAPGNPGWNPYLAYGRNDVVL